MATLQDLTNQCNASVAVIDTAIDALAAQLGNANANQRNFLLNEIASLQGKKGQLQATFVQNAMQTADIQNAITQISNLTNSMNQAAQQINDISQAVQLATQILGYVVQIAGIITPFI